MQWKRPLVAGVTGVALVGWSFAGGSPAQAATAATRTFTPRTAPAKPALKPAPHAAPKATHPLAVTSLAVNSPVHTYNVNVAEDEVWDATPGVCETGAANGRCSLRAAVQAANADGTLDLINIPLGSFALTIPTSGSMTDDATGSLKLMNTGGTIIQGHSSVIDGAATSTVTTGDRVFTVPDGYHLAVQISGATFQHGDGGTGAALGLNGGGIYNGDDSTMTLTNVRILNNNTGHNTNCCFSEEGGGIYNYGALGLNNTWISGNTAYSYGGGIGDESNDENGLAISNSHVDNNTATNNEGGGAYLDRDTWVTASTFNGNWAGSDAGGIYASYNLNLTNSQVNGNYAAGYGGGIYADYNLLVLNSTVNSNSTDTSEDGGGIYVNYTAHIEGSDISFNTLPGGSGYGGGLYNDDQTDVVNSTLRGNVAYKGGAVYNNYGFSGRNLTFDNNDTLAASATGKGGAFYNDDYADVTNSTFTHNTSYRGGALYNASYMSYEYSNFSNNYVSDQGGAIYNDDYLTSNWNVVDHNVADGDAGGLYQYYYMVSNNDAYTNNTSFGSYGGGVYNDDEFLMTNGLIGGNIIQGGTGDGGGMYNDAYAQLTNVTIANNRADGYGGGLYENSAESAFGSVTIASNQATLGGGGFYGNSSGSTSPVFTNSIFSGDAPDECAGSDLPNSGGYNVAGDSANSCGLAGPKDQVGVAANLGALAPNGGPTWTKALLPGSAAIDAAGPGCPAVDQRGINRPQGAACDAGAYERLAGSFANNRYLTRLYSDLLHRSVDPAGLAFWGGRLDSGAATPASTAAGIISTDEFRANQILDMYRTYLHREPVSGDVAWFVSLLRSGMTYEQVRAVFVGSDEYYALAGGTDSTFIAQAYTDVVGRIVDAGGTSYWSGQLTGGATHQQVATGLINSNEARAYLTAIWYSSYLHRGAEPAAINGNVYALGHGTRDETLIGNITGSAEYYSYAQSH